MTIKPIQRQVQPQDVRRTPVTQVALLSLLILCGGCQQLRSIRMAFAPSQRPPATAELRAGEAAVRGSAAVPHKMLENAQLALDRRDPGAAVRFGEIAVRVEPREPASRAILARAYLAAGRLRSADQAHGDWLVLQPDESAAHLGRALTRMAADQPTRALAEIAKIPDGVLAGDVGLALALTGETGRGVDMLMAAARESDANATVRQNLALALALDGRWAQARAVAAQDLAPDQVDARIAEWSRLTGLPAASRTLAVLGVTPVRDDAGRPQVIALELPEDDGVAIARQDVPDSGGPMPGPGEAGSGSD